MLQYILAKVMHYFRYIFCTWKCPGWDTSTKHKGVIFRAERYMCLINYFKQVSVSIWRYRVMTVIAHIKNDSTALCNESSHLHKHISNVDINSCPYLELLVANHMNVSSCLHMNLKVFREWDGVRRFSKWKVLSKTIVCFALQK